MVYIIDANNLVGQMGIINQKNFDKILIDIISYKYRIKAEKIFLIFDGIQNHEERYIFENINIIYAVYNDLKQAADRKILEIINFQTYKKKDIVLITNDIELQEEAKNINSKIKIIRASIIAEQIQNILKKEEKTKEVLDEKINHLTKKEIEEINNDLLCDFLKRS